MVTAVEALGAGEILLNCIDKDGSNSGFDLELIDDVKGAVKIPVIASSGAGVPAHFEDVFRHTSSDAALGAGMVRSTHFCNANGLADAGHSSTAVSTPFGRSKTTWLGKVSLCDRRRVICRKRARMPMCYLWRCPDVRATWCTPYLMPIADYPLDDGINLVLSQ